MRCLDWFNMVCDLSSAVTGRTCISGSDKESSKCIHFTLVNVHHNICPQLWLYRSSQGWQCGVLWVSLHHRHNRIFWVSGLLFIIIIYFAHYYYLFCRLSVYRTILNTLWLLNYTDCSNTTYIFILINFENFKEIF